jgi:hypothetical protein
MNSYQKRVVEERNALDLKLNGLCAFVQTETFQSLSNADKVLLNQQKDAMRDYLNILETRIKGFYDATNKS